MCPAKIVLGDLNERLQQSGRNALSFRAIASQMRPEEIPAELAGLLRRIESCL
jgi:hypothetical protein